MKVKAKKSIRTFNATGMPCTIKEFRDLKDGKAIAVPKEVGERMIAMGLIEEVKKVKTKGDK